MNNICFVRFKTDEVSWECDAGGGTKLREVLVNDQFEEFPKKTLEPILIEQSWFEICTKLK